MCFINLPLRGIMWNMQGAEQNYFTPGLFACSQWKVLKCISYDCFACCLSMFSIRNRLRTNKQFFFKVDNRELLKFTDKSQFWLILSTNNRYCTWRLTLMSLSILIVICKLFVEMKNVLGLSCKEEWNILWSVHFSRKSACFKLIDKMGASKRQLYCTYISWSLSLIVKGTVLE